MCSGLCAKTPRGHVGTSSDPDLSALQELVEWVLEEVAQRPRVIGTQGGPLTLEVGCGSGAISLSLLSHLPQVSCLGTFHPTLAGRLPHVPAPPVSAGGTVVAASNSHPLLSGQRGESCGYFPPLAGGWRTALAPRPGFSQHPVFHVPVICSWDRAKSLLWIREKPPSA